ncbi:hypothetical protein HK104_001070 [Borealophlyctis nickersoniae]|nr:hypothetical protein HK104_001070 [Borealophlyctis nickersoniae]
MSPTAGHKSSQQQPPAEKDQAELEFATTSRLPPGSPPPIIIVAAHEDDITIGLAGTLHRLCVGDQEAVLKEVAGVPQEKHHGVRQTLHSLIHKKTRQPVYAVILSDGRDEKLYHLFNGKQRCEWHNETHQFGFSHEQVNWARKIEVAAILQRAGVDKTFLVNDTEGLDNALAERNPAEYTDEVTRVLKIYAHQFPGATWFLISGKHDGINGDPSKPHPAHQALWDTAYRLRTTSPNTPGFHPTRTFFYRVYEYMRRGADLGLTAGIKVDLDPAAFETKKRLLDEHKLYDPRAYRYATGYHSYRELIDRASEVPVEFFDRMEGV